MVPDATFADSETIPLGSLRLRAIHTPGHTPGHACFYHEESGVLFTGDHILKRITPNPGLYFMENRYEKRSRSLPDFLRSMAKLQGIAARRVLGAHEGEMGDLRAAIDRLIRHHERRAGTVLRAIDHGRTTGFELLPLLFPNLRVTGLHPALSETIGHLDLLEERGAALPARENGLLRYRRP